MMSNRVIIKLLEVIYIFLTALEVKNIYNGMFYTKNNLFPDSLCEESTASFPIKYNCLWSVTVS